jgi:hypothetical protein
MPENGKCKSLQTARTASAQRKSKSNQSIYLSHDSPHMQCKIQVKKICEMRKSRGDERCNAGKARSFRVLQCNEERKNKKQGMEDMQ